MADAVQAPIGLINIWSHPVSKREVTFQTAIQTMPLFTTWGRGVYIVLVINLSLNGAGGMGKSDATC